MKEKGFLIKPEKKLIKLIDEIIIQAEEKIYRTLITVRKKIRISV